MLKRLVKRLFGRRLLPVKSTEMVINKEFYRRLVNDSVNYHKLLKKVEEINKGSYFKIDLDPYKPIDSIEIPDYLPDDL